MNLPNARSLYEEGIKLDGERLNRMVIPNQQQEPSFLSKIGQIIGTGIVYSVAKSIPNPEEETVPYSMKASFETSMQQKLYTLLNNYFPFWAHRYAFSKSASDIKYYYTLELDTLKGTEEIPLTIQHEKDKDTKYSIQNLRAHAAEVIKDPINNSRIINDQLNRFFNNQWAQLGAANAYMNNDLHGREDLYKFFDKLVKLDIYLMQQDGKRDTIDHIPGVGRIIRYAEPNAASNYIFYETGNVQYYLTDGLLYNSIQLLAGREAARDITRQSQVEEQFNQHIKTKKSFHRRRPQLEHYT
jgi:hypothetical protein